MLRDSSSSGAKHTPRLRARWNIANTKKLVKGLRKLIKTKQTPRAADPDAKRGFGDTSEQNGVKVWLHAVNEH